MSPDVETPAAFDAEELAEYIEIFMLVNGLDHLSAAELRNGFAAGQGPSAAQVSFAFIEMERRSRCSAHTAESSACESRAYPYRVVSSGILRETSEMSAPYDFMLLCSIKNAPMRDAKNYTVADPLFDAIVREASAQVFGHDGRSLVFAFPPRDGRPTNFSAAVSWVGEKLGIPDLLMDRPTDEKDAGVDVIAWRPFADGRIGFPVYLFQNTLRANFTLKAREVEPEMWRSWLEFGKAPHVGFATPFALHSHDDRWRTVSHSADIILDRQRITENMRHRAPFPELAQIREFNADQLLRIATGQTGGKIAAMWRSRRAVARHRGRLAATAPARNGPAR